MVLVILHYLSEQKYYVHADWKKENQGKSGQIKEILWLIQGKFWSRVGKYVVGIMCAYTITKYGSTLYIGMDEVFQHHTHTFEKSDLNFHFQCEFSSVAAEW